MDAVFKALADASRRDLLDRLRVDNGQTLNELCTRLDMTRQAVSKHLGLLEEANLVATVKRGREKLHYLNPVPIHEIGERWIGKFERGRLQALSDMKQALESSDE
ncbi:MAG TPA: metalloregulator ArsR/SmtB family transcription factor [Pseudolabrys sp.]|jgi:DNA-binding transcriptional ArsR family regulator